MKSELDALMQANDIDVILVTGPGQHNPAMVYLTGVAHLTQADLIKKRGETPVVFHGLMERDEAAKSGLATRSYSNYPWERLMKEAGQDVIKATVLRYQRMFKDLNISSDPAKNGSLRVMLYGRSDVGQALAVFGALQKAMPEIEFVWGRGSDVISQAMFTKSPQEVERIRSMGKITVEVVRRTAEFLTSHAARKDVLVRADGEALTIGNVKAQINLWLAELGAENPKGAIFSIGRDAGVPHSSGNPQDVMRLGQTIIYDIFPCEAGGGYFFDFTRTWSLGYATDEALALYENVRSVFQQVRSELKINQPYSLAQRRTCELFGAQGHPTPESKPETEVGYIHSVGHGVGLNIHERPFSGTTALAQDLLLPGCVFTLEPGLYYPERGLGVRLEDTLWATPDGRIETLVEYPYDLVLPVSAQKSSAKLRQPRSLE